MEIEAVRMCAAALADSVIGVNAMLDAVTIDDIDTRPTPLTIYNSVDHRWVARKSVPEKDPNIVFPALAVLLSAPLSLREVGTAVRDGDVTIMFAYIERDVDSAKVNRDALYTNHALLRFLRRFNDPSNGALRQRNGIQLINPTKTEQGLLTQQWSNAVVIAATQVTWLIRDTAA